MENFNKELTELIKKYLAVMSLEDIVSELTATTHATVLAYIRANKESLQLLKDSLNKGNKEI